MTNPDSSHQLLTISIRCECCARYWRQRALVSEQLSLTALNESYFRNFWELLLDILANFSLQDYRCVHTNPITTLVPGARVGREIGSYHNHMLRSDLSENRSVQFTIKISIRYNSAVNHFRFHFLPIRIYAGVTFLLNFVQ